MVDQNKIMALLKQHFTVAGDITIDDQGRITVKGSVWLNTTSVIPPEIKFLEVTEYFRCNNNPQLTSLVGSPDIVGNGFLCDKNPQLTSLEGGPLKVGGGFVCSGNPQLKSLKGAPLTVGGNFYCFKSPRLQSLDHLPAEIPGRFVITWTKKLPLLRALVAKEGVGFLKAEFNPQKGEAVKVAAIINRYRGQGQSAVIICAAELAAAGFKANARW